MENFHQMPFSPFSLFSCAKCKFLFFFVAGDGLFGFGVHTKMTLQRHFLLTLLFLVVTCSHTSSQISFSTNWGSGKRSSVLGPGLEPGDSDQSSWDSAKRPNIFAPRDSESINWGSGKLIGLFGARDSEANCFSRIEYNMLKDLVEIVKVRNYVSFSFFILVLPFF